MPPASKTAKGKAGKKSDSQQQQQSDAKEPEDQQEQQEEPPVVVNLWDWASMKNNLEDRIKLATLLATEGFEERFARVDFKLALYASACLAALICCVYGYFVPHPDSSLGMGVCVFLYFAIVGLATLYLMFYDPGYLLEATRRNPEGGEDQLLLRVYLGRFETTAAVEVIFVDGKRGEIQKGAQEWPVTRFYYADGELATDRVDAAVSSLVHDVVTKKKE